MGRHYAGSRSFWGIFAQPLFPDPDGWHQIGRRGGVRERCVRGRRDGLHLPDQRSLLLRKEVRHVTTRRHAVVYS